MYCQFFHVMHLDSNAEHTAVDQVHLYLAPPHYDSHSGISFLQLSVIRCWHVVNIYKQVAWIDGTWNYAVYPAGTQSCIIYVNCTVLHRWKAWNLFICVVSVVECFMFQSLLFLPMTKNCFQSFMQNSSKTFFSWILCFIQFILSFPTLLCICGFVARFRSACRALCSINLQCI